MKNLSSLHYNGISTYLKNLFGCRIIKLSIDGGFTCPNRDGKCGTGGCFYCSEDGSGDFAGKGSIKDALSTEIELYRNKWPKAKYIAYFQSHTNTYAPVRELRSKYEEALSFENVIGLAIATRPDCLEDDVLDLLSELNKKTFLWIELGLQTANDTTAANFNRGYKTEVFKEACQKLRARGIAFVVHLILGLPGETKEDMLSSAKLVALEKPFGIKLHMLHVMKNTEYERQKVHLKKMLSLTEYVSIVCDILEHMPEEITIHRLTGDAPQKMLLAPDWTRNKHTVLNEIQKEFKKRGTYQGINKEWQ